MTNHYHVLIETPDSNLSKGMRQLNGVYTQTHSRMHRRVGHVFQGRYKAIVVEKDSCLLELARHIVLNPVRARLVRNASEWRWSSYRATAGLVAPAPWLNTNGLLSVFGKTKRRAIERYKTFVSEGRNHPSPWEELKNQMFLGSDEFVEGMHCKLCLDVSLEEVPKAHRRAVPKPLGYYQQPYRG